MTSAAMGTDTPWKLRSPYSWVCSVAVFIIVSCGMVSAQKTMLCYYKPTSYCPVSAVPADVCSHLVYSFGVVSPSGIKPSQQSDLKFYRELVSLKKENPQLKVLLSLQSGFPSVVDAGTTVMEKFSSAAVQFLTSYGFDGVDLDWEFPKASQKDSFKAFIRIFSKLLKQRKLSLSLALPNNPYAFKAGFDVPTLSSAMDLMTVMSYDFHVYVAGRDNKTGYNSPLYTPKGESSYLSTAAMIDYYQNASLPMHKVLMGIPAYGRSWKLAKASVHGLHAPAIGKGDPGPYRGFKGVYLIPDVCTAIKQGASSFFDRVNGAAYLYNSNADWVAFDCIPTVDVKVAYAKKRGLGGIGVWALHLDDITGVCGAGKFPLLEAIKKAL